MGLTTKVGAQEVAVARLALAVRGDRLLEVALEEETEVPRGARGALELVEGPPALRLVAQAAQAPRVRVARLAEQRAALEAARVARAGLRQVAPEAQRPEAPQARRPEAPVEQRSPVSGLRRRVLPSA